MKILSVLLTFATFQLMAQDIKTINVKITDVTVFLSGAQITMNGEVSLKSGEQKLRITGLGVNLDPNSIRVEGNPNYSIMSVRHEVNYLADARQSPEIREVLDSINEITSQLQEIGAMRMVYDDEIRMLMANSSIKGQDDQLLPEDLGEMANFFRNRLKEIRYKGIELTQRERKYNESLGRLQNKLNSLNARQSQNPSEVIVTLNVPKENKTTIKLAYFDSQAGWAPVYDLRAEDINADIDFAYRAKVYQSTGSDWNDVNLTISTGNPTIGGQTPELYPWYLYLYEPRPRPVAYENSNAPAAYSGDAELKSVVINSPTKRQEWGNSSDYVQLQQNAVNAEFKISVPYDIPSDNRQYDVVMQHQTFKASYVYVTVPKLDNGAYLRAQVTNWMQYALLPGESNIYFKGTYVGKGFIDPALANDTLNLSLGRDQSILVKREQVKDFCSTSLFGSKQQTVKSFDISVVNTKKQAVNMEIIDQIPISQNEDIQVSVDEISGGNLENATGKVTWKLSIQPNETVKKTIRFTTVYPKKKLVSNL